ncbi:MAG: dTMP kinase [archaeon]|jgi:dTMP kinase
MVGTFIAYDGGPGSGKGTMIRKTFEYVYGKSKKYDNILITDEPTNGPFGKKVRELFKQQKSPSDLKDEILDAFIADRKWHIENIIQPALDKNFVVIADRYKYGSIAYQTVQGSSLEKCVSLNKSLLAPNLALILDVEPAEAIRRISSDKTEEEKRKQSDNFRQMEFVSSLRNYFLQVPSLLPNENIHIIDANKPVLDVFSQIKPLLDKVLF